MVPMSIIIARTTFPVQQLCIYPVFMLIKKEGTEMAVKTGTVTGAMLSAHIKDTEWQCHDGTKTILYSTEILDMLEELRAYGGFSVTINSGQGRCCGMENQEISIRR